ncbi:MAG: type II secretion system protein [Planctomycetota bacterium]|nr:type II secretion system protein [Planctomycetota bacterium]
MKRNSNQNRAAFTLTEILVVAVIISILMAIVVPAVFSAIVAGKNAAIAQDINQIQMSFEGHYKSKGFEYPPTDLRNPDLSGSQIYKYVRHRFPNYDVSRLEADLDFEKINYQTIDPSYSLVFWMVGFHPDSTNPFRDHAARMGLALRDPNDVSKGYKEPDVQYKFMDFKVERLTHGRYFPPFAEGDISRYYDFIDANRNGIWENGEQFNTHAAYLYFDNQSYRGLPDAADPESSPELGDVLYYRGFTPYRKTALDASLYPTAAAQHNVTSRQLRENDPHYNNESCQINSAGLDADMKDIGGKLYPVGLGNGGRPPAEGEPFLAEDADNIANFSSGSTMGDFTDK